MTDRFTTFWICDECPKLCTIAVGSIDHPYVVQIGAKISCPWCQMQMRFLGFQLKELVEVTERRGA